jgi:hypothetical protein
LDGGHDVQHPVDLPVPCTKEGVTDLVAGSEASMGGGAVPAGSVRESGDLADLDE